MAKSTAETEAPAEGTAPAKAASPWPALIAAMVLMPAISFATTQFVLLPKLRGLIAQQTVESEASKSEAEHGAKPAKAEKGAKHGKEGKEGKEGGEGGNEFSYVFDNVVVNLSGAMGTRYLKTSFTAYGTNAQFPKVMEESKTQLLDVTLGVLSSRTLADLEAAGAKDIVRNDLMANINEALKSDVVKQIYFTEFVVQ